MGAVVKAGGRCGSDLHFAAHGREFNAATQAAGGFDVMDLNQPVIFGHEFVGRIAAYGHDTAARIPVGGRVVSAPFLLHEQKITLGVAGPEAPGGYSERMLLSEPLLIEVPDHVPTELAALTEPLAVAYRTVARVDTSTEDAALVIGCGPIGLAVIAVLKMKGISPIVASDFSPERRALARQLGVDVVVDPNESSPYEAFRAAAMTDDGVADAFERLRNSPREAKILIDPTR
ncbi:zinc-binding dehydrogenase [Mycobacterium sp.]|uniref:zinc-binding dehydrogenase n=1 Tax=Mycobacterium sp. TaxID=1785 RepID=UPI003A8A99B9